MSIKSIRFIHPLEYSLNLASNLARLYACFSLSFSLRNGYRIASIAYLNGVPMASRAAPVTLVDSLDIPARFPIVPYIIPNGPPVSSPFFLKKSLVFSPRPSFLVSWKKPSPIPDPARPAPRTIEATAPVPRAAPLVATVVTAFLVKNLFNPLSTNSSPATSAPNPKRSLKKLPPPPGSSLSPSFLPKIASNIFLNGSSGKTGVYLLVPEETRSCSNSFSRFAIFFLSDKSCSRSFSSLAVSNFSFFILCPSRIMSRASLTITPV